MLVDTTHSFTATVNPEYATWPLQFTWSATGQTNVVETVNGNQHTVTFEWTDPGTKTIQVSVQQCGDTVSDSHTLELAYSCFARVNDNPTIYHDVQPAVDAAAPGDVVKVAGLCRGTTTRSGVTQAVYLDKSITIEGGLYLDRLDHARPEGSSHHHPRSERGACLLCHRRRLARHSWPAPHRGQRLRPVGRRHDVG
jgi:hypothetical protein